MLSLPYLSIEQYAKLLSGRSLFSKRKWILKKCRIIFNSFINERY